MAKLKKNANKIEKKILNLTHLGTKRIYNNGAEN